MAFTESSGAASVAVATTDEFFATTIREDTMAIELNPTANALDAFEIWAKMHSGGAYVKLKGVGTDFTTPKGIVKDASGDPTIAAAGTTVIVLLAALTGIFAISLRASAAVGVSTLNWKVRVGS